MKKNILIKIIAYILLTVFALTIFSACTGVSDNKTTTNLNETKEINNGTPEENITEETKTVETESDNKEEIRVFENYSTNVKLFPNGTFIANLSHNAKITETYSETVYGNEIIIKFIYGGVTTIEDGTAFFEEAEYNLVIGGIEDNVLKIPEEWDDGHGHGDKFTYRVYPLVFLGENDQKILLNADGSFVAEFEGDNTIIGFYAMRTNTVTFVPGNLSSNKAGEIANAFIVAELITIGNDEDDHEHGEDDDGHDDEDEHDEDDEDKETEKIVIIKLPEVWEQISGGSEFILQ